MAGDSSAWLENVKDYLQPVAKAALDMKVQIEGYNLPPAMVKMYQKTAGAVGVEDKSPFYVCLCVIVVSSALLLATCSCSSGSKGTAGRKKKKLPAKKKKTKAKSKSVSVTSNGSAHKNGDVSGSGTGKRDGSDKQTVVPMANGSAPRGLPAKAPKNAGVRGVVDADYAGGGGAGVDSAPASVSREGGAAKPAKKPAATKPQKDSGKSAGNGPPVITEEPEPAKKRVRKKKTKAAVAATAAGGGSPGGASVAKKGTKHGSVANGSSAGTAGESGAVQKKTPPVEVDVWEEQPGGEWQPVQATPPEAEWETVSHKKSRPRKEKAPVDGTNVIPGGLGL